MEKRKKAVLCSQICCFGWLFFPLLVANDTKQSASPPQRVYPRVHQEQSCGQTGAPSTDAADAQFPKEPMSPIQNCLKPCHSPAAPGAKTISGWALQKGIVVFNLTPLLCARSQKPLSPGGSPPSPPQAPFGQRTALSEDNNAGVSSDAQSQPPKYPLRSAAEVCKPNRSACSLLRAQVPTSL